MSTPLTVTPEDIKAIAAAQKWSNPYINASLVSGAYVLRFGESYGSAGSKDRSLEVEVNGTFKSWGDKPDFEFNVSALSHVPGDQLSHVPGHVITLTNLLRQAAKDGGKAEVWVDFNIKGLNHPEISRDECTIRVHRRALDVNGNTVTKLVGLTVIETAIYQNNGSWGNSMLYKAF